MNTRGRKAFTLIELLIVVAIIAILAAIAVPNFLEAQTRSKVSRVKADMRSIATAIEAYRVDTNYYPPDGDDLAFSNPLPPAFDYSMQVRLRPITTPVAYISALPTDVFNINPPDQNFMDPMYLFFPHEPPYTFIYLTLGSYFGSNTPPIPQPINNGNPTNYTILSVGPDQTFSSLFGTVHYDPTNGTVSSGDVLRQGGDRVTN